ncbi:hypothetical protein IH982_01205 [Patescibacteria group bacterium]|nr:hypothetical protein [Patescibacteria group bacterium]
MVKKIYRANNRDGILIVFEDGKQVGLTDIMRGVLQNTFRTQLENIKMHPIPQEEGALETRPDEVTEVIQKETGYYLEVSGDKGDYDISVSPEELKTLIFLDDK